MMTSYLDLPLRSPQFLKVSRHLTKLKSLWDWFANSFFWDDFYEFGTSIVIKKRLLKRPQSYAWWCMLSVHLRTKNKTCNRKKMLNIINHNIFRHTLRNILSPSNLSGSLEFCNNDIIFTPMVIFFFFFFFLVWIL